MKFTDMLYFAVRGVMRGRTRTILSALAVAIGASSILLISSLGEAGRQAVLGELEQLGISGLTLYRNESNSSAKPLTVSDVTYINENIDGVQYAMPLIVQYGEYGLKNWRGSAVIWGVGSHLDTIMNLTVEYGRLPNSSEIEYGARVAVIDDALAKKIYKRDNIVGKPLSVEVDNKDETFRIIGVISSQKNGINELVGSGLPEFVYIPYTVLSEMAGEDSLDQIAIRCFSGFELDVAGQNVLNAMDRRHRSDNGYSIENISSYRDKLNSMAGLVSMLISAIAGISLGVAGLGVMNSMLSSTVERRREIGVCMAIGAKRRDIALCFLMEAFIICFAGGLAGVFTGSMLSLLVTKLMSVAPIIKPVHIILSELISTVFGLAFGVLPAVKASGLDPIIALREE